MPVEISIDSLEDALSDLAAAMKSARMSRRLSKGAVAELIGVSLPTYETIESGNTNVKLNTYLKCIQYYGMNDSFFNALTKVSRELEDQ